MIEPTPRPAGTGSRDGVVHHQISASDISLVILAALAVGSAAVLARWSGASPLALAFWRCFGGALLLAPALVRSPSRPAKEHRWLLIASGFALGVHFATWLASLDHTTVAASVTLASTAPIFVALWLWLRGEALSGRTWGALAATIVGVVIITGGAVADGSGQLLGNGLALVGALMMATYLLIGGRLRAGLDTVAYSVPTYAIAAVSILPIALATNTRLVGYDGRTWFAIVAMILGPQLAGHTVLNALLPRLGSITVALALLTEPIGAAILAWLVFAEVPGLPVWLGAPLVIGGLALHTWGSQSRSRTE